MKNGKYAARQRGNQVVIFLQEGKPVDYSGTSNQVGMPSRVSLRKFNETLADRFYLVPDPGWVKQESGRITPEMKQKAKVRREKEQEEASLPTTGYSAQQLLTLLSTYAMIYSELKTEASRVKLSAVSEFIVRLDAGLKEKVKEQIKASTGEM